MNLRSKKEPQLNFVFLLQLVDCAMKTDLAICGLSATLHMRDTHTTTDVAVGNSGILILTAGHSNSPQTPRISNFTEDVRIECTFSETAIEVNETLQ